MPTYLCHGFRWHRSSIRIFVGWHDLMDAAPDWIISPATTSTIIHQLHDIHDFIPEVPAHSHSHTQDEGGSSSSESVDWSPVKLLEEHDPTETVLATRPYAYVADYAVRIDLSASIASEMANYEKSVSNPWLNDLRDKLQKDEEIQWYVVVCGDEDRHVPGHDEHEDSEDDEGGSDTTVDQAVTNPPVPVVKKEVSGTSDPAGKTSSKREKSLTSTMKRLFHKTTS